MELQELKNLEQQKVAEAREMQKVAREEKRGLTPEELEKVRALIDEAEQYREQYEAELRIQRLEAGVQAPYDGQQDQLPEDRSELANFGDFVQRALLRPNELRDMGMEEGEGGGFAVPDQFRPTILMVDSPDAIVRPNATVIEPGTPPDAKLDFPAFKQGAEGVYGGVTFTQVDAGTAGKKNDPKLDLLSLEPKRFSGYVLVSNNLLRNAPAMSSFIEQLFGRAKLGYEDVQFISGEGGDMPLGLIKSPGKIGVDRDTTVDIKWADVLDMLSATIDSENWMWLAHKKSLPKIAAIADANGNSIFIQANANRKLPATLMGYPIRFTGKVPALGSEADLCLIDMKYYLIKEGSGPFVASSEHYKFIEEQTAVRMTWYVDGQLWVREPLTLEDGSTQVSPVVVLKA